MSTITVFVCRRASNAPRCKCSRKATVRCGYPLRGAKTGMVCDAPLCERCAADAPKGIDALCPVHARVSGKDSVRL